VVRALQQSRVAVLGLQTMPKCCAVHMEVIILPIFLCLFITITAEGILFSCYPCFHMSVIIYYKFVNKTYYKPLVGILPTLQLRSNWGQRF